MTYAPSASGSGTLTVNYSYIDNSGTGKTGSADITYSAASTHLYVTDYNTSIVSICTLNADGTVGTCAGTGSGFDHPTSITFFASRAYITNDYSYTVSVCTVGSDGTLSGCVSAGNLNEPQYVSVNPAGTLAYVWDNSGVNICSINASDGTFSSCTQTGAVSGSGNMIRFPVISADGTRMYGTWYGAGGFDFMTFTPINEISLCPIQPDGTIPNCSATGSQADSANLTFALTASTLYASRQNSSGVIACPVNSDGSLGVCQSTAAGSGSVAGIAVGSSYAYLVDRDSTVTVCPVTVGGLLGSCTMLTPVGFSSLSGVALH